MSVPTREVCRQVTGYLEIAAKELTVELPGGTVVRFTPSWPDGHLTVSAIADWGMKSWAENPEKTQAHVTMSLLHI